MFNKEKVKNAITLLLEGLGEDITRDGLLATPDRVARMYEAVLTGYDEDTEQHVRMFESDSTDMVIVKNIPIYSFCEHHIALFQGVMHIGYIPNGKVIGISKLVRIARVFAKRLQIQERLTMQVVDELQKLLAPVGVAVYMEAEHTCMTIRGVRAPGATTVTSAMRGVFLEKDNNARMEFMAAIAK